MALKSYSSVTKGARITNCFTMCFLLDTGRKMNVDKTIRRHSGRHETKRDKTHFFAKRNQIWVCEMLIIFYIIFS